MVDPATLPYRPCVGVLLVNRDGRVFVGQRADGPEQRPGTIAWQMPQGGIDPGEDPYGAALRELWEETSVRSAQWLAESADWYTYDLPPHLLGKSWGGRYRGQRQKWFALRFLGEDGEINIHAPGGGAHEPEFIAWQWERLERLPELIVPFKRQVYEGLAEEFARVCVPG